ncbi:hypothetical protein DdX_12647 [Ditylenchus destructor]|uniref:Uncharacterized protein n=1 Tax=Ditylenchus destructor TaxID=166010 RepID=A0AAD4R081_9BILA|nr:hypothetical protein DdX_12647 [Ditylenchus destructor]
MNPRHIAKNIPLYAVYLFLHTYVTNASPVGHLLSPDTAVGHDHRAKSLIPSTLRQKRSAKQIIFKEEEEVCPYFEDRKLTCNQHTPEKKCVCFEPSGSEQDTTHQCQASIFHILESNIQDYVLTIGIGYPLPEQFIRHPDEMFAEDIELFTSIPRESVVILRKGCNPQRNAFEFQFGLLKEANNGIRKYHNDRLRTIHPDIFTQNHMFMEENGLYIEYVEKADPLRPLYGESSHLEPVPLF